MPNPRFLQIHTLHSYTAALLNRDDSGLAKRLPYGGSLRTRISSQCLKRHWRFPDRKFQNILEPFALQKIEGFVDSKRSRELVTKRVIAPLRGKFSDEIINAIEPEFQKAVYGKSAETSRQTLLFGEPELKWLAEQAEDIARSAKDAKSAQSAVSDWANKFEKNIKVMRDKTVLPAGLIAALFGRMVTSDPAANIDAPVHVAHAFTVHAAESESDYFTAMDDLKGEADDGGADTIQETELTSGLFYGYVVVDLPGLIRNCGNDKALAARVVHNLVCLIAEVSPGAKLGSTAPYDRASLVLLEAGDRQPRSLSGAYRKAIAPDLDLAVDTLDKHLSKLDATYATGESRRYLTLADTALAGVESGSLAELATWAAERVGETL